MGPETPVPVQIGFVLEWFPPHVGGVETLFDELTRALVANGYIVRVITTWFPGAPPRETRNGVHITRVRTPRVMRRYFFTLLALPAVIRELAGVDIIHTTTYNAAPPAWLGGRLLRKPTVVTVHEVWGDQWQRLSGLGGFASYGFRAFEWLVLHLPFARYVCDSGFTRQRLLDLMGVDPLKADVVYPAVDYRFWDRSKYAPAPLREQLGLRPDTFVYLYFGRPGVSKGVEHLLTAAVQVRRARPNSHVVLLMSRDPLSQYAMLMRRRDELGLTDYVTVLDPVPRADLPPMLLAADCVCVPSISEGFGYAAVEAATLGCKVIATTGHSVEEVLPGAAVFVPPADAAALAGAMLEVATGPVDLAAAPRTYSGAEHVRRVEAVYQRLLDQRSRRTQ